MPDILRPLEPELEKLKGVAEKYDTLEKELGNAKSDLSRAFETLKDFRTLILGAFLVLATGAFGLIWDRMDAAAEFRSVVIGKNQQILELQMEREMRLLEVELETKLEQQVKCRLGVTTNATSTC